MHPFNQYEQVTARHEALRSEVKQYQQMQRTRGSQPGVIQILIRRGEDVTANMLKSLGDRLVQLSTKLQEKPALPETGKVEWAEK